MCYTFVKITTFQKGYLKEYYSKNPAIVKGSYKKQYNHLMYDSNSWADFYQQNLEKLGINSYEIVYNAKPLQNAWARENGTSLSGEELLIYQLKKIKPDIVFFQDSINFNGNWIDYLRSDVTSIKKIVGSCCSPFTSSQIELFRSFDFMITCSPAFAKTFNDAGLRAFTIYHAFEPKILERLDKNSEKKFDFIFIGSLIPYKDFHDYRILMIEKLLDSQIDLRVYTKKRNLNPFELFQQKSAYLFVKMILATGYKGKFLNNSSVKKILSLNQIPQNVSYSRKLKSIIKKPVYGLEMLNTIKSSKINLNIHGGVAGEYAVNMRLFETTGVGTCLITDWKKNLTDLFKDDDEVISFKSPDECIEKVQWLLNNPKEIEEISLAGQKRTFRDHTYEVRAKQLNEIILNELNKI